MSLQEEFKQAQTDVRTLTKLPTNDELLSLYSLLKQATEGDNKTSKPGMFDIKGQFKWKAWNEKKGMSSDEAMQKYIDVVAGLLQKYK
jgi:acyl-CoA-binding protein